jgi:4-hydroxy-3-methylbut-2-enyl diphosphate reductase
MKVYLVSPRGFCSGVKRALNLVQQALLEEKKPIYVLHEIVHNSFVIEDFKKNGVAFVESLEEIPMYSTVIFSAHGACSMTYQEALKKELKIIDATCPLVTKLHTEVLSFLKKGYIIFLLGKKKHQEIQEVYFEDPSHIILIESEKDIETLPIVHEKVIYFTQTTLPLEEIQKLSSLLQKKYPQLEKPMMESCYATIKRQKALKDILPLIDAVLVVGDEKSANSKRLKEIAECHSKKAYLFLDANHLNKEDFVGLQSIAITAGASTPEILVQRTLEKLHSFFPLELVNAQEIFS